MVTDQQSSNMRRRDLAHVDGTVGDDDPGSNATDEPAYYEHGDVDAASLQGAGQDGENCCRASGNASPESIRDGSLYDGSYKSSAQKAISDRFVSQYELLPRLFPNVHSKDASYDRIGISVTKKLADKGLLHKTSGDGIVGVSKDKASHACYQDGLVFRLADDTELILDYLSGNEGRT